MANPSSPVSTPLLPLLPGMTYRCLNDEFWTMLELHGPVEEITGRQPEDFIRNLRCSFSDLIHEDDRDYVSRAVSEGLLNDGSYYIDYRLLRQDGEIVHVWEHGSAVTDDDGEIIELVGYIYNATSNVKKLERQQRVREASVALARDPNLARGHVELFARQAVQECCRVLGVSSADVWLFDDTKTRLDLLIFYQASLDRFTTEASLKASDYPNYFREAQKLRVIDAYDAQNDPRTCEFNQFTLKLFNVKSVLHCAIRQAGNVVGMVCLEQVAEHRRWEAEEVNFVGEVADQMAHVLSNREIREAENRLLEQQATSEARSHFLSIMSHEIRTPLNGVLGVADLLNMTELDAQQLEYVGLIEESGRLLLKIIGDILDFTKIDTGQLEIRVQPTDLRGLCRDCMQMVRPQAQAKLLNVAVVIDDEVPQLCQLDALRLQQVLLNVLTNAIKFTYEGEVTLKVDLVSRGSATQVAIAVIDSGVGIDDELAKKIFEPFTQDRMENMNSSLKGAGLGLPICRGLVELMGGRIELQSEKGKGTVFRVLLPLEEAAAVVTAAEGPCKDGARCDGLRVLVAEDNSVNQKVIVGMLKYFSVIPDVCGNGQEAVERVMSEAPYDLILMDCEMPVMDGFDAVTQIRALEPPKGQVFIAALTAHALQEYRERAERVGMNDYLTKPLHRDQLQSLLQRLPAQKFSEP